MGDRQSYEDSRKGYPVTFDNLSEEYERYREDMVTALAAKDEEIGKMSREWHDLLERYDALVAETYGRRLPCREAEVAQKRYERAEADADTQFKLRAQAEAEVALRDRMLRDIIERIALTPELWNGWTTKEVLADLRARAEKEATDAT